MRPPVELELRKAKNRVLCACLSALSPKRVDLVVLGFFMALMTLPSFWVMPAMDDWAASAPLATFKLAYLMPNDTLWRPLQHLFRYIAHWFPYPGFAHATNAIGHGVAVQLVYLLALRCRASTHAAWIGAFAYCVAPAVGAAVWSVDSENQIWSNVCGLTSAYLLLSAKRRDALRYLGWLSLAFLAALWNEGGIAWFAAAPCLKSFVKVARLFAPSSAARAPQQPNAASIGKVYTTCASEAIVGIGCVVLYFTVRFLLLGYISLGTAGARYGIGLNPISILKHIAMLLGMALSTADTLAILSPRPHPIFGAVTFALGVPFIFYVFRVAFARWSVHHWSFAIASCISIVAPFAVMGHVSEMYAFRPAAVLAVVLSSAIQVKDDIRPLSSGFRMVALLALVASLSGNAHKLESMVQLGRVSVAVGKELAGHFGSTRPSAVCVICEQPKGPFGYSVFEAPPGIGSGCGLAARMQWGWDHEMDFQTVISEEECTRSDVTRLRLSVSGGVQILRLGTVY